MSKKEKAIEVIAKMLDKYYVDAEKMNLEFVIQQIIAKLP